MEKNERKLGVGMNRYQRMAEETANYPRERALDYVTLGLAGEAGEVANKRSDVLVIEALIIMGIRGEE